MPAQPLQNGNEDDLRDRPYLTHADILQLNFIRSPGRYVFRRHYRAGLRSHLMEVLDPEELAREKGGMLVDGLRRFPRAVPLKMLRIFRRRFLDLTEAMEEIRRVKTVVAFLAPDHIARPSEFLVDYLRSNKGEILLAGLQEYVPGEVLEPWGELGEGHLHSLLNRMPMDDRRKPGQAGDCRMDQLMRMAEEFVSRLRNLIMEARLVPDLAGVGNMLLTPTGGIKLVDINNISEVSSDPIIPLDDRGYPVCDKSIAVLFHLEQKLTGRSPQKDDPLYAPFLNPERIEKVKAAERRFHLSTTATPFE